jgi:hypothetical protein
MMPGSENVKNASVLLSCVFSPPNWPLELKQSFFKTGYPPVFQYTYIKKRSRVTVYTELFCVCILPLFFTYVNHILCSAGRLKRVDLIDMKFISTRECICGVLLLLHVLSV